MSSLSESLRKKITASGATPSFRGLQSQVCVDSVCWELLTQYLIVSDAVGVCNCVKEMKGYKEPKPLTFFNKMKTEMIFKKKKNTKGNSFLHNPFKLISSYHISSHLLPIILFLIYEPRFGCWAPIIEAFIPRFSSWAAVHWNVNIYCLAHSLGLLHTPSQGARSNSVWQQYFPQL